MKSGSNVIKQVKGNSQTFEGCDCALRLIRRRCSLIGIRYLGETKAVAAHRVVDLGRVGSEPLVNP